MTTYVRSLILLVCALPFGSPAIAQQTLAAVQGPPQSIRLNVHVAPKKGTETDGLEAKDFHVLDNNVPTSILSFKAATAEQKPVKVILVIDAVNTDFTRVAYARDQAQRFLKLNDGHLANPTTIAVLTDRGTQIQKDFTSDGNALSSSLDNYTTGLREITRASGIWGADERVDVSLHSVRDLTAYASSLSGRKILLWISPGWPLLSGARIELSSRQQKQIFGSVVAFSNELQKSDVTMYNINPLGVDESLYRADYYQSFVKGVATAHRTDLADLSLQVLAVQSGGLSLNGSNDVLGGLKTCVADFQSWYELTVPMYRADRPDEYHHVDVKTDKPGLITRTRDGYYAQP
jgi:VWFA-related protein